MREIKFRGKTKEGKWVHGSYLIITDDDGIEHSFIHQDNCSYENVLEYLKEVIPETVGQLTGLKDENGIDIYEADLLDTPSGVGEVQFIDGKFVIFIYGRSEDGAFAQMLPNLSFYDNARNTILTGNIHDKTEEQ